MSKNRIANEFKSLIEKDEVEKRIEKLQFAGFTIEIPEIATTGKYESYYECGPAYLVHRCDSFEHHIFNAQKFMQLALRHGTEKPRAVVHSVEDGIDVFVAELDSQGRVTFLYTNPNVKWPRGDV